MDVPALQGTEEPQDRWSLNAWVTIWRKPEKSLLDRHGGRPKGEAQYFALLWHLSDGEGLGRPCCMFPSHSAPALRVPQPDDPPRRTRHSSCWPARSGFQFLPVHEIIQIRQPHLPTGTRRHPILMSLQSLSPTAPGCSLSSQVQPPCSPAHRAYPPAPGSELLWTAGRLTCAGSGVCVWPSP